MQIEFNCKDLKKNTFSIRITLTGSTLIWKANVRKLDFQTGPRHQWSVQIYSDRIVQQKYPQAVLHSEIEKLKLKLRTEKVSHTLNNILCLNVK